MIRRTSALLTAAAAAFLVASPVHASDVSVYLPASYLAEQLDAQLEAGFATGMSFGTLSWDPTSPGVRIRQMSAGLLGVSADLLFQQVLTVGGVMFSATVPADLTLEVAFDCDGVIYEVDARNVQIVGGGVTFTGPALNFIETSIEGALNAQTAAMDTMIMEASTAYGLPMQSKCVAVKVDGSAELNYQFDLGCVEGSTRHENCPQGEQGSGRELQCVNREWVVTSWGCLGPHHL